MTLPVEVIEEDRRLAQAAQQLAELRWHWTLDPSNPDRVNFAEYARQTGMSPTSIARYANGYQDHLNSRGSVDLDDAIKLAQMRQDTATATSAVAAAEGVSVSTAQQNRKEDVKRVRQAMDDYHENNPESSPEDRAEVARRTAQNISTGRKLERDSREELLRHQNHLATVILGYLAKAREGLQAASKLAEDSDYQALAAEYRDRIAASSEQLVQLIADFRATIKPADWDAEARHL